MRQLRFKKRVSNDLSSRHAYFDTVCSVGKNLLLSVDTFSPEVMVVAKARASNAMQEMGNIIWQAFSQMNSFTLCHQQ
jgi:hypothetical protein